MHLGREIIKTSVEAGIKAANKAQFERMNWIPLGSASGLSKGNRKRKKSSRQAHSARDTFLVLLISRSWIAR